LGPFSCCNNNKTDRHTDDSLMTSDDAEEDGAYVDEVDDVKCQIHL